MDRRLVIQIMGNETELAWFLEGEMASGETASGASLGERSWDDFAGEVLILVPTVDVYLTKAKLPPLSHSKLVKVIPYAVEDEVVDDVKACHFAVAEIDSAGYRPIAVVNRERMSTWLQLLPSSLQSHSSLMTPEVLGLPWEVGTCTIGILGEQALVRIGEFSGFAVEKNTVLEIMAHHLSDNNAQLEKVLLISPRSEDDLAKKLNADLQVPVLQQTIAEPWVNYLSKNLCANRSLNLLQGDYQSAYAMRGIPQLKRIFVGIVASWLVLLSLFGFAKWSVLSYQAHQLNAQLAVIYNDIFPGTSSDLSPKKRVEVALAAVKKAKAQSVFLRLVSTVSPVLVNTKGLSVQSTNFSNGQLDVQLEVSDFEMLDKITADLRSKGVFAEQSRAAKAGSVIQSHLLIREIR